MMYRIFIAAAAILAGLSVAAGAFASHALKETLTVSALAVFETAAKYQMYHALALLVVALLLCRSDSLSRPLLLATGIAFIVGIVLFSGSLYVLSLTGISGLGVATPFGGVAFLVGWACLAVSAIALE